MFVRMKKLLCPILLLLMAALLFTACDQNSNYDAYSASVNQSDYMAFHVTGLVANGYIKEGTTVRLADIIANIEYAPAGGTFYIWRPGKGTEALPFDEKEHLTVTISPAEGTVLTDKHKEVTVTATYVDDITSFTRTHTLPVGEEHATYTSSMIGFREIDIVVPDKGYRAQLKKQKYDDPNIDGYYPATSVDWGGAADIELVIKLAGDSYNQRVTLLCEYNGETSTLWEDTVYSEAKVPVKLLPGENRYIFYMNLEEDGGFAASAATYIVHQLRVPNILWQHWTGSYMTLSNYGIDANEETVEGTTFTSGMAFAAEVYYRTADGGYGELIGSMDTSENQEDFLLPAGVTYEDIVVRILLAKPLNKVPNVVGMSLAEAIKTLNALGYGYQVSYAENSAAADIVIAQPDAGAEKEAGFEVSLTVSSGPAPVINSAPLSSNAALASLTVTAPDSASCLQFDPNTLEYYMELPGAPVTITATAADPNATITGTGSFTPAAREWVPYPITVTAADGVTTCTYIVYVWI